MTRVVRRFAEHWILLVVALVAWQIGTTVAPSVFFPPPTRIAERLAEIWFTSPAEGLFTARWASDLVPSLGRVGAGWALAVLLAVVIGLVLGLSRTLDQFVDPALQFLRAIPPPAIVPLFLILFGTGSEMRIALIAFGAFWPLLLNTIEGVRTVSPAMVESAAVFGVPRAPRIARIVVPAALPKVFAGLRVSLSIAIILMVLSEMVASRDGVGQLLIRAQSSFAMVDLWAAIVVIAILGVGLNGLLTFVERGVLAWHVGARGRANDV